MTPHDDYDDAPPHLRRTMAALDAEYVQRCKEIYWREIEGKIIHPAVAAHASATGYDPRDVEPHLPPALATSLARRVATGRWTMETALAEVRDAAQYVALRLVQLRTQALAPDDPE